MYKNLKKVIITAACILSLYPFHNVLADSSRSYSVTRIYGNNRYETCLNISKKFNNQKVDNVIIASGNNFPDALAGSVLSKKLNAPILLADRGVEGSMNSIDYLKKHFNYDGKIYVLGEKGSVSKEYVNYIKNLGCKNIIRLGGSDRFDTNKKIVDTLDVEKGTPVVITNAYGFADALSVSSVASSKGYPILMSNSSNLSDRIKQKIKDIQPSKIYLIGGTGSLNNSIISQAKNLVPQLGDDNIVRIGGATRYDTSLAISKYFNMNSDTAVITSGKNFPDALSGSALAAQKNAPIILTDGQDISSQKKYLDNTEYKNLILLGGTGAINSVCENILNGSVSQLDVIKSKSVYKLNMKDNNQENYSVFVYSDNAVTKTASFYSNDDWSLVWAGAAEGETLAKGNFKIAVVKDGEDTPYIYDNVGNIVLNLSRNLVRVHENSQLGNPDFLLIGQPQFTNGSFIKVYYIKDGKLNEAKFIDADGSVVNEAITFSSLSIFFNQTKDNIFEMSTYDNSGTFMFYIHSWKFDLDRCRFIYLGTRSMSKDDYFRYQDNAVN
ncbi:cell wall-binding repeat-containing protein [Clostridium tyrobutyricum]|mgnify:CR=1 FL=1|uniref:cell wall-binding repeat-containing protein n=1 Tax=Clostridium tyrobutyricum TaxID=1519 RepID=UPI00073D2FC5|nr:cell wall-binding repeat-containing protein [Clostridium tyrobutyricum]MBV4450440.1 cell wall-binding repeat-containing protein [Clostridium tyrobutyricum]